MSQRVFRRVRSLSQSELADIVKLASTAFHDKDPSMLAFLGGDVTLKDEFLAAMIRATLLEGEMYVVECNAQVVSVALWFRKPMALFKTDAQRALGYNDWFDKLPMELQHWWTEDYPEQLREFKKTIIAQEVRVVFFLRQLKLTPSAVRQEWDKMWFCHLVITDPKYHNKGHATFLMNELTAKVRQSGEILGLSTNSDANALKYKSMGFREKGRTVLRSLVNEVPSVWLTKE